MTDNAMASTPTTSLAPFSFVPEMVKGRARQVAASLGNTGLFVKTREEGYERMTFFQFLKGALLSMPSNRTRVASRGHISEDTQGWS